uniref:Glucuronosyltransferase n=1 Tax=Megaselia scalaris TaxID=36166 RepID=T1GRG5_MEGSC
MQAMAEKHFGSHIEGPLPSISDLEKNISLILVNSHRATDSPRPTISGLVDIGGAHIQKPKPLPKDIQDFIDSANDGVVYFSLGSFMKCADMPKEKLTIIIDALGKLKQKVLWKYEDESIELPRNVMIKKWMPQNDILAQKNVVLFITHGGRFGTLEGSYWGKPMLAIPLFGDQHTNIQRLKRQGVALSLDFLTFTSDELVSKVNTLLTKPFVDKARKISSLFQDNPIQPMDEAMYWIECVIRHKGAPHLKSKAVDMSVFQYLLLDILAIHLGTLVLAGFALFAFVRMFIRLFKKTAPSKKATNKKMK